MCGGSTLPRHETFMIRGCSHLPCVLCVLASSSCTGQGTLAVEGGGKWEFVRDPGSEQGLNYAAQRVGPRQALGT